MLTNLIFRVIPIQQICYLDIRKTVSLHAIHEVSVHLLQRVLTDLILQSDHILYLIQEPWINFRNVGHLVDGCPQLERSEERTSELQSRENLVCRLLLDKKSPHHHDARAALERAVPTTLTCRVFHTFCLPPTSTLLPYTTLFRSIHEVSVHLLQRVLTDLILQSDHILYLIQEPWINFRNVGHLVDGCPQLEGIADLEGSIPVGSLQPLAHLLPRRLLAVGA